MSDIPTEEGITALDEEIVGQQTSGGEPLEDREASLWSDAWDVLKHNPMFWISVALIIVFIIMAAFPQLFTSQNPNAAGRSRPQQCAQWSEPAGLPGCMTCKAVTSIH